MQKDNKFYNDAIELYVHEHSHEELISFLQTGSVVERQFAALNLTCIKSNDEAKALLSNLVGVDGKIREAAALKIFETTKNSPNFFFDEKFFDIFVNATIDIDGNVCRLAIESAKNLKENNNFSTFYAKKMIDIINTALTEMSNFTFKDKKYKINKQIFKIYWCLEALVYFNEYTVFTNLKEILLKCSKLSEYTVREKCANILCLCKKDEELEKIFNMLKNDENYYVRNVFTQYLNN